MAFEQMVEQARRYALYSGTFTDDLEKLADDVYLVADIEEVVRAFVKDIEAGKLGTYDSPEKFLDAHGIVWR